MVYSFLNNPTKDLLERIEELRQSIVHYGLKRLCASNIENKQKLKPLLQDLMDVTNAQNIIEGKFKIKFL